MEHSLKASIDSINDELTDVDFKKRIAKFKRLLNKIIKEGKQL